MTIHRLFNSVLSNKLFALFILVLLTACSTEENYTGSLDGGTGSGVIQGTAQVILAWVAPVEREDGTPISMSEIAGYRVYYGMSEGDYTNEVDISDRGTMQATLSGLLSGIYYIVVTTYDMEGRESSYSPVVIANV